MSSVSQMFGIASSVAYARCGGSGNNTMYVLASLASGFGAGTGDGVYIYNLFNSQTGFTQSGFQNSDIYTTSLENSVASIVGMAGDALIGSAAIIYSYSNFPNIPEAKVIQYINSYCNLIQSFIGGANYSINSSGLEHIMRNFSLSGINASLAGIGSSPDIQKAINYNWYDSSGLFANPNFSSLAQKIKDSENQYYYLSGEFIYPSIPSGLNPCVEFEQTTMTPTGQITFSVIANTPCFKTSSYIGPISGVKFFREFNDGPGSSGYFDSGTQAAYISFDEAILSYNDYHSNTDILYSNIRDSSGFFVYLISGGQVDSQGFFIPSNEYGIGHTNALISTDIHCQWQSSDFVSQDSTIFHWADYTGTGLPLMRMHQGDNLPKWVLTKYCTATDGFGNCISCGFTGQLYHFTGWKFSPFSLKESLAKNFEFLQMNPAMDTGRVIKRALNLNNDFGISPISPYQSVTDTGDGALTCTGMVGPPLLSSDYPSLPGFAFYQTFDNITFPDYATLVVRASIESGGNYVVSNFDLITTGDSGVHFPVFGTQCTIPIYKHIPSSGLALYDDVTKKCLAIGDNFGGNGVSGIQTQQSNAGYSYTGFTYYQSGYLVEVNELLAANSHTVGSAYSTINYLSGYTGVGGTVYSMSSHYAFVITGDTSNGINYFGQPIIYSYFSDGVLGASNTGWSGFAPIPSGIIDDIENNSPRQYGEVYTSQKIENFIPRYSNGPYLSYENSFLYPNAQVVFTGTNASTNGFPVGVAYQIQFNEETVTELYSLKNQYGFSTYPNVIRASGSSKIALKTSMVSPFVPDNQNFDVLYSFVNTELYPSNNNFSYTVGIGLPLVDANYVPSIDFTADNTLNSIVHNADDALSLRWKDGVKINYGTITKRMMTGIGQSGIVYISTPAVKNLFWGYYGKTLTGIMNYALPIYSLETESLQISSGLNDLINTRTIGNGLCYQGNQAASWNGSSLGTLDNSSNFSGREPIFYEFIGGRIGSGASNQGGSHTEGIIGDSWYDFNVDNWGVRSAQCADCPIFFGFTDHTLHGPENDAHLFLLALSTSGLNIHTKNLSYYPYYYSKTYRPFVNVFGGAGLNNVIPRWLGKEYYFDFDLKSYFPLVVATGATYSQGLNIGPFDRDIELCVQSGNIIFPSGALIIDGIPLTTTGDVNINCYDNLTNVALNSGIITNEGGRSPYISTFKLIPQGTISNINFSGTSGSLIGLSGKSIVTIRPRTFDGSVALQQPISSQDYSSVFGEKTTLDFSRYINNGAESNFQIPLNSFDLGSLNSQTFSFQTVSNKTLLYPQPDVDFYSIVPTGIDAFGNTTYPPNPTAYYWSIKNANAFFTGIRDVSRVSFTIKKIAISGFGEIPYQSQRIIIPSGECIVSGVFGYTGQAESAIVSDGIVLSGLSGTKALSGLFQPLYISDVMTRIPSGIFNIPSGSGYKPILPAPSYMKIRQNPFYITGGDVYIGISPFSGAGYNAFLWPAWSDLALLNPEIVYEQMPPDDGNVFMGSYLTFSASQGQKINATGFNPSENVTYKAISQYGFIDSTSTNAIYNTGACIFSGSTSLTILDSGKLSGILTSEGNSLTMAINLQNFRT